MGAILQESAFLTEVHHITKEGKDGGVVYCEMLASQFSPEGKIALELHQALYPPSSTYHYTSGGLLKNLRTSCNNEKVSSYAHYAIQSTARQTQIPLKFPYRYSSFIGSTTILKILGSL